MLNPRAHFVGPCTTLDSFRSRRVAEPEDVSGRVVEDLADQGRDLVFLEESILDEPTEGRPHRFLDELEPAVEPLHRGCVARKGRDLDGRGTLDAMTEGFGEARSRGVSPTGARDGEVREAAGQRRQVMGVNARIG